MKDSLEFMNYGNATDTAAIGSLTAIAMHALEIAESGLVDEKKRKAVMGLTEELVMGQTTERMTLEDMECALSVASEKKAANLKEVGRLTAIADKTFAALGIKLNPDGTAELPRELKGSQSAAGMIVAAYAAGLNEADRPPELEPIAKKDLAASKKSQAFMAPVVPFEPN